MLTQSSIYKEYLDLMDTISWKKLRCYHIKVHHNKTYTLTYSLLIHILIQQDVNLKLKIKGLYILLRKSYWSPSRVGNFIIGASGSDKQMLSASSGTRAAPNKAVQNCQQKKYVCYSS